MNEANIYKNVIMGNLLCANGPTLELCNICLIRESSIELKGAEYRGKVV